MSHFIAEKASGIPLSLLPKIQMELLPTMPVHGYVYEAEIYSGADSTIYNLRFCFDDNFGWLISYNIVK